MIRRLFVVLIAVAVAVVAALISLAYRSGLSEEEMARLTASAAPTWENYPEDIKAQIGAGPVAEWQGKPVKAVWDGKETIEVTFEMTGPWATIDAAIPILLRDPLIGTHEPAATHRQGNYITYSFTLYDGTTAIPLPWVEVKHPAGQDRIMLIESTHWEAG